jgi:hypothetical protein
MSIDHRRLNFYTSDCLRQTEYAGQRPNAIVLDLHQNSHASNTNTINSMPKLAIILLKYVDQTRLFISGHIDVWHKTKSSSINCNI